MGYGFYYGWFDPTMILVLIGVLISAAASAAVNGTFQKYASVRSYCGMTGAQVAERLLHSQGIYDVAVRQVPGNLTDHYDPRTKTVNLSQTVYGSASIAALGVAAHECGHAIQDAKHYVPLKVRGAFVPVANLGAQLSVPLIIIGIILGYGGHFLVQLGIWMFVLVVAFQVITLPVEFNASSRAIRLLGDTGILSDQENSGAKKVLGAAAMTYVASVLASLLQLLRLVILFGGRRRDE